MDCILTTVSDSPGVAARLFFVWPRASVRRLSIRPFAANAAGWLRLPVWPGFMFIQYQSIQP